MKHKTVLSMIMDFIFGHKYYANIINTRGVSKCELACFIFHTREEANKHRDDIGKTASYAHVETVSFRSYNEYVPTRRATDKKQ